MLLLNNFFSSRLLNTRSLTALQQLNRQLKSVTPIINQKNFHLKCSGRKEEDTWQTGLLKTTLSTYQQQNLLRKYIHGHSALNFRQKEVENNNKSNDESDDKSKKDDDLVVDVLDKKLGIIARFKKMTKEYWYVLIPVHCFTSCFWFGGFYYASLW